MGRYGEVELDALAAIAEEPIGDLDLVPLGQPAQLAFEGAELLGGQVHLAARVPSRRSTRLRLMRRSGLRGPL